MAGFSTNTFHDKCDGTHDYLMVCRWAHGLTLCRIVRCLAYVSRIATTQDATNR